jgi:hypothetical protein
MVWLVLLTLAGSVFDLVGAGSVRAAAKSTAVARAATKGRPAPALSLRAAARAAVPVLTPGIYPLRTVQRGAGPGPEIEPLPLPVTATPPPVESGPSLLLPRFQSTRPLYTWLGLGNTGVGVLAALDESWGTGAGYDRLYADLDLNGNLAAHAAIEGRLRRSGELQTADFDCPALPAVYRTGEGAAACEECRSVRVRVHGYRLGDGEWRFTCELGEFRVGEIGSPQGPVRVVLADSSMRGAYDQRCVYRSAIASQECAGPQLWLSPDPTAGGKGEPLHLSAGAAQLLGGQLYRLDATPVGDALAVQLYEGPLARARIAAANARRQTLPLVRVTFLGGAGRYEVGGDLPDAILPEGDYFAIASVRQPDGQDGWSFRFRSRAPFRLPAAGETQVAVGGPLRAVIAPDEPRLNAKRGQTMLLKLLFLGAGGQELFDVNRPGRMAYASVVVRSASGRIVARSRSGFG